jgi:Domain of unknown function (DUF6285)
MQDLPTPEQLLAAVARFLREDAGPALARHGDNALAYQARVAANMVDTVARQTHLAPAADAAECQRLQVLLGLPAGDPDAADLAALNRRLASRLADGTLDSHHPGLADHLWATTLAKLAVDQPSYDTCLRHAAPNPMGTP